jgi:hypothetical protein
LSPATVSFLLGLIFKPEDGGDIFFSNIWLSSKYRESTIQKTISFILIITSAVIERQLLHLLCCAGQSTSKYDFTGYVTVILRSKLSKENRELVRCHLSISSLFP